MSLCEACESVDFLSLLVACVQQCQHRQDAYYGDGDGTLPASDDPSWQKHRDDIFEVETWAQGCALCKVVFEAFEKRNVFDPELARGLPLVFRPHSNKVEVCYNSGEGLIKLCGLDMYMNGAIVDDFFRACRIKEDDSPPILKTMEKDPSSKTSLETASKWLRSCLDKHNSCIPTPGSQRPPKRLINVGNETQNPFLVDIAPGSQQIKWLSLSYCWGEEPSLKLSKDTISMLRSGIALHTLDPTIRDAIFVTRALEIPYIWIDALCIVQDSGGQEWNEEAPRMNEIYGGSIITLIVSSSKSVREGFLKERQLQYIPISLSSTPGRGRVGIESLAKVFLSPEWDENEDSAEGSWSRRGWTMQEGLLPSRLLYYTSFQMIWRCCTEERFERGVSKSLEDVLARAQRSEDDLSFGSGWLWELEIFRRFKRFRDYLPSPFGYHLPSEWDVLTFRLWYDLIEEYTPRQFKDVSDRLVALSGLAKSFGNIIQCDEYVAGLWKPDLIRGLIWHADGAKLTGISRRSPHTAHSMEPSTQNIFPSWSWASAGYEVVRNDYKSNKAFQTIARLEGVHIGLVDQQQPFSGVKDGSVTLTGPLKRIPKLYNEKWKSSEVSMSELERHLSEIVEVESSGVVDPRYSSPPGGHFALLQMLGDHVRTDMLVLEANGEVSNGMNKYLRVGVLTLRFFNQSDVASPALIALLKKTETSLTARLGPQRKMGRKIKGTNKVVEELKAMPWRVGSITII